MATDNLLPFSINNALQRAYPSGLPANMTLQQFVSANDTTSLPDNVVVSSAPNGYPYGWGERINVNESTNGTYTYSLTEPDATMWLIRMDSYQPSGSTVTLTATVGGGTAQTLTSGSPAMLSYYADLYPWSTAPALGQVGISPWGKPTNWPDDTAWWIAPTTSSASSAPVGAWLARKWIFCPTTTQYTLYGACDDSATVYVDGAKVLTITGYADTATGTVSLTAGIHLVTVEVWNYGTSPSATGLLLSVQGLNAVIVENGNGEAWETTGFIGQPWSYNTGAPLLTESWYMINAPSSTSVDVGLTLAGSPQAIVTSLWWYSVAPWRWSQTGEWNATANNTLPIA